MKIKHVALMVMALLPLIVHSQRYYPMGYIAGSDIEQANELAKKFKDERFISHFYETNYSFDTDKNEFGQPVVTVQEDGRAQFVALKGSVLFQHYFYYNKFLAVKKFTRSVRQGENYSLVSSKPYDRAVTDENIFFDDSRIAFHTHQMDVLGRKAQSDWSIEYKDAKYLTRVYFNEAFAVEKRVIEFTIPAWLDVELKEYNFKDYKIVKEEDIKKSGKRVVRYIVYGLPGIKQEEVSIGPAYIYPHLVIQIKSFERKGEKIRGFENLQDVYNWYSLLYSQCKNDVAILKPIVQKLTANLKTDEEKIQAIYYWVQDNIRYIAYEDGYSGYIPSTVQETVNNKYGDCKAMANLLTEMLKLGGYDAHYTWIGTNHIPYGRIPSMCVDNHCISTLYFKGKVYFLDGTESYAPFGENAWRLQGKSAFIEKGKTYEEQIVPVSNTTAHTVKTKAQLALNADNLKGHITVTYSGNMRTGFQQYYQALAKTEKKEEIKSAVEFGNSNVVATNIKTSDLNNRNIPVQIDADIDFANAINIINNEVYVGLDFFPKSLGRYYPEETRKTGYEFKALITYNDEIELTLPADRKCIDLPEPLTINNDYMSFSGSYTITGNKVVLKKLLSLKAAMMPADKLTEWRENLDKLKDFNRKLFAIVKNNNDPT
jgi:hypothetical protein